MGWLNQAQTLTGTVRLPRQLSAGRYYVFFFGYSYDSNATIKASIGGAVSSSVTLNDRDANGLWSEGAIIDTASASDTLQITINRNPSIATDQTYLFRGLYI